MQAVCAGDQGGRRDRLSLRLRAAPVRVLCSLFSVFFDPFLDDAVWNGEHLIYESREAFVFG